MTARSIRERGRWSIGSLNLLKLQPMINTERQGGREVRGMLSRSRRLRRVREGGRRGNSRESDGENVRDVKDGG